MLGGTRTGGLELGIIVIGTIVLSAIVNLVTVIAFLPRLTDHPYARSDFYTLRLSMRWSCDVWSRPDATPVLGARA